MGPSTTKEMETFGLSFINLVSRSPKPCSPQSLSCTLVHPLDGQHISKILKEGKDLKLNRNEKLRASAAISAFTSSKGGPLSPSWAIQIEP